MMPFIETPDGHFIGGSSVITKYICKKAGTVFNNLLLSLCLPLNGQDGGIVKHSILLITLFIMECVFYLYWGLIRLRI